MGPDTTVRLFFVESRHSGQVAELGRIAQTTVAGELLKTTDQQSTFVDRAGLQFLSGDMRL